MCAIVKNQRVWEQAPVPCTEDLAAEATRASAQGKQVLATTRWFEGMQAPVWGSSVFTRTVSYDEALTDAVADCNQRSLNATDQQKLCNRTLSAALTVDAMPKTMGACCYIPVPAATLAQ